MLSTDAKLTELVKRLKEFAASNLECVILFGSAARGDFREGHSDLNVVGILHSLTVEELGRLAAVFHARRIAAGRGRFCHRDSGHEARAPRAVWRRSRCQNRSAHEFAPPAD